MVKKNVAYIPFTTGISSDYDSRYLLLKKLMGSGNQNSGFGFGSRGGLNPTWCFLHFYPTFLRNFEKLLNLEKSSVPVFQISHTSSLCEIRKWLQILCKLNYIVIFKISLLSDLKSLQYTSLFAQASNCLAFLVVFYFDFEHIHLASNENRREFSISEFPFFFSIAIYCFEVRLIFKGSIWIWIKFVD